jgi:predicted RNase H-like HicB family nuclease
LIEGLQVEVKKLATPKEEKVAADGQTFTVVLTPDLEEGGYTVQCQEIPGAISEGDTEQETLDNIIEVLEEVLGLEPAWGVEPQTC